MIRYSDIPVIQADKLEMAIFDARNSHRKRSHIVLHETGDYTNKVFNIACRDSYMQPHQHPSREKIERMYVVEGAFRLFLFDDLGNITSIQEYSVGGQRGVEIPAYTWHTYVMLSDLVITYETMDGVYDPSDWKKLADWAPCESSASAKMYLESLQNYI